MKSFKQFAAETTDKIKSPDEQNFADKHMVDKKDLPDDYKVPKPEKDAKKDKTKKADRTEKEDEEVYEQIDAELESLDEAVLDSLRNIVKKKGAQTVKFGDGSRSKVDAFTASALVQVYDKLNKQNQKKFADTINKTQDGFMKMMDFAMSKTRK